METTKNNISPYAVYFFNHLSNYLDTKLYFFGSVQRADYFPNSSDIDVDIFSENVSSTLSKMQHFLHVRIYKFKKLISQSAILWYQPKRSNFFKLLVNDCIVVSC